METLMFLRKLTSIEIINKISNESYLYECIKNESEYIMKATLSKDEKKKVKESTFRLVKNIIYRPKELSEEMRQGVTEVEVLFGFEVDKENKKGVFEQQNLYAFLPIRKYGFKFLIQADFVLISNREDIAENKEWNRWIRDELVTSFIKAIDFFKSDDILKFEWYSYIPILDSIEKFFQKPVKILHEKLL
jgi:hypothetical protein